MRLKNFFDDFLYFRLLGFNTKDGIHTLKNNELIRFESLGKCMYWIYNNLLLLGEINEYWKKSTDDLVITMQQYDSARSSKPNHILHYSESAIFRFNKRFKLIRSIYNLRKIYDPSLSYITIYSQTPDKLYYGDTEVIARDFFEDQCLDRELAQFLLKFNDIVIY